MSHSEPHRPSTPLSHERRRHPRVDKSVPFKISSGIGDIVTETKNLSCSGAFCRINQRLEPMTVLKIQLLLPLRQNGKVTTKKVSCQGVVVRAQLADNGNDYDTAIFFNTIAPKDTRTIQEFIDGMMEAKEYGKFN